MVFSSYLLLGTPARCLTDGSSCDDLLTPAEMRAFDTVAKDVYILICFSAQSESFQNVYVSLPLAICRVMHECSHQCSQQEAGADNPKAPLNYMKGRRIRS